MVGGGGRSRMALRSAEVFSAGGGSGKREVKSRDAMICDVSLPRRAAAVATEHEEGGGRVVGIVALSAFSAAAAALFCESVLGAGLVETRLARRRWPSGTRALGGTCAGAPSSVAFILRKFVGGARDGAAEN